MKAFYDRSWSLCLGRQKHIEIYTIFMFPFERFRFHCELRKKSTNAKTKLEAYLINQGISLSYSLYGQRGLDNHFPFTESDENITCKIIVKKYSLFIHDKIWNIFRLHCNNTYFHFFNCKPSLSIYFHLHSTCS